MFLFLKNYVLVRVFVCFRNVLKEGDKYFNTGDIFILDDEYNLHFNDRVGDTFR